MVKRKKRLQKGIDSLEEQIKIHEDKKRRGDSDKIVEDFFNTPKLKNRFSSKEMKKIILQQYDEEIP